MPTQITPALLKNYFIDGQRHLLYTDSKKQYDRLRIHANAEYPKELIEERRPNEEEAVHTYRKKIYKSVTKGTFSRIMTCLEKIRKSRDMIISFPPENVYGGLAPEEYPSKYFEELMPFNKSLMNWSFDVMLKNMLIDPNGLILVMPIVFNPESNQYREPYPYIFNSDMVLEFVQNDYCIVQSHEFSEYKDIAGTKHTDGKVYYVATTTTIQRWEQTSSDGTVTMKDEFLHNSGYLPAWKMKGVLKQSKGSSFLFESRIDAVADFLDEAAREGSDFAGSKVMHNYLEKWRYQSQKCNTCKGLGSIIDPESPDGTHVCGACNGSMYEAPSPYKVTTVYPTELKDHPTPMPPGGFIARDIETARFMREEIELHLYHALSSINFEHLAKTPLNESGVSKEWDRDEAFTKVYSVAEDVVYHMDNVAKCSVDQRYMVRVPDEKARRAMAPIIPVPEKFDIMSTDYYIEQLDKARKAGVNPYLIKYMEIEVAGKQFSSEPEKKRELELILSLDPLPGLTDDQKAMRLTNKGITQEDYVISCYIYPFVKQILAENPALKKLQGNELEAKLREELKKKAAEKVKETLQAQQRVMSALPPDDQLNAA